MNTERITTRKGMINYENVCAMYCEGELLTPLGNNIKPASDDSRVFADATIEKIMNCIRPGRGFLVVDICAKLNMSQSSIRRYCKHMREKGMIHGQRVDKDQSYGVFAYYLVGDRSIPATQQNKNEKLVLDVIRHNRGITKLDIRKKLDLTEYTAKKTLNSLLVKKEVKAKNIAGAKVGNRIIYAYRIA